MAIRLLEVTRDTVAAVCKLDAGDGGRQVAPNAVSIAQAHFAPEAWFRAVYDDAQLVGFLMLYDPTLVEAPKENDFFLWRLMIDCRFQGRGYGRQAVECLVEHVKTRPGAERLRVSHVKGAEHVARFYESIGFRHTGREVEGELEMERQLR